MSFSEFSTKTADDCLAALHSSRQTGLTGKQARELLVTHGKNVVEAHEVRAWEIFVRQFRSSFVYLMVAAALIALFLQEWIDAGMISMFVTINATLGFYQEFRSEQTLKYLKQYIAAKAKVRRDGKEILIDAAELVPGDVLLLEAGDVISSDVRFLSQQNLVVDESVLSGESAPVAKSVEVMAEATSEVYRALNIGFSGTIVTTGRAEAVVIATGRNTVLGDVTKLAVETTRESSFQKGIDKVSGFILRLVLVTLAIVFAANVAIKGVGANIAELFIFSVALAVSVIPEALPTVTTFSLSRGALRLAKNKVVVKRLSAIEDLGSIEVLCSDKTGTLTENKLTVSNVYGEDKNETLFLAAMAATFVGKDRDPKDPFDVALWDALPKPQREEVRRTKRLGEIPFDPMRRRNSVLVQTVSESRLVVRGAAESVLAGVTGLGDHARSELRAWIQAEGRQGHRVIAVAAKSDKTQTYAVEDEKSGLRFVGCVSFVDPIKHTTRDALRKAEHLGVRVKILTGDSREVAGAVAYQVGLIEGPERVITGEELEKLTSDEQHAAVLRYHVFARVSPAQKFRIIQLLQESKQVGFLGEGINDAPALKIANVALVVQGAADVAREAADIVLLKTSLEVIVDGIKEGREVFANTIKYIRATLTSNFGNFYALVAATFFIDFLPMLPLQILLLNLLTDFPMIAIAADTVDKDELKKPRGYDVHQIALFATLLGLVSTIFDFIFFAMFRHAEPSVLQTNWFIGSILTELVLIFSIRTKFPFLRARRPSSVLVGLTSVAAIFGLVLPFTSFGHRLFMFAPPRIAHIVTILVIVGAYFVATETVKLLYFRKYNHV